MDGLGFKSFIKNPLGVISFAGLLAVGTLHYDLTSSMQEQINDLKVQNAELREEIKELQTKYIYLVEATTKNQ